MVDAINATGAGQARLEADKPNMKKAEAADKSEAKTESSSAPSDINEVRAPQNDDISVTISAMVVDELEAEGAYALAAEVQAALASENTSIANNNPDAVQGLFG